MIDRIQQLLQNLTTPEEKYNRLREFLQLLILKKIDEHGCFRQMAFVGGTALRILYDLNRFSEDLDFSLVNQENYDFEQIMKRLETDLRLENLEVSIKYKSKKTVASAFIKFHGLLHQLNLSPRHDQALLIKFEVDQNPPLGWDTKFSMVNSDFLIGINHYDLPSLFAGKLHALLYRKYTKGRDYYDFIWYIGRKVKPNLTFLNNAIYQTQNIQLNLDWQSLSAELKSKFNETDFSAIRADVSPFLVDLNELRFFEKDSFISMAGDLGMITK